VRLNFTGRNESKVGIFQGPPNRVLQSRNIATRRRGIHRTVWNRSCAVQGVEQVAIDENRTAACLLYFSNVFCGLCSIRESLLPAREVIRHVIEHEKEECFAKEDFTASATHVSPK